MTVVLMYAQWVATSWCLVQPLKAPVSPPDTCSAEDGTDSLFFPFISKDLKASHSFSLLAGQSVYLLSLCRLGGQTSMKLKARKNVLALEILATEAGQTRLAFKGRSIQGGRSASAGFETATLVRASKEYTGTFRRIIP